eukprot:gene14799-17490_t
MNFFTRNDVQKFEPAEENTSVQIQNSSQSQPVFQTNESKSGNVDETGSSINAQATQLPKWPASLECGADLDASASQYGWIQLQIQLKFENPNRLEVEVRNFHVELFWEGVLADAAAATYPQVTRGTSLGFCEADDVSLDPQSDIAVTALCTVYTTEVLARALEHIYAGAKLTAKGDVTADVHVWNMFAVGIDAKLELHPETGDEAFGNIRYVVLPDGTVVRLPLGYPNVTSYYSQAMQTPPPPFSPNSLTSSQTVDLVISQSASQESPPQKLLQLLPRSENCDGTVDLPLEVPTLTLCDIGSTQEWKIILENKLVLNMDFIFFNQMGFALTIAELDLSIFWPDELESMGEAYLREVKSIPPHTHVELNLRATIRTNLWRVLDKIGDNDFWLDITGTPLISFLNMTLSFQTPRLTVPVVVAKSASRATEDSNLVSAAPTTSTPAPTTGYQNSLAQCPLASCLLGC